MWNQGNRRGSSKRAQNAVSDDVKGKVKHFFLKQDIVWTSPSIKDEMTVWDTNGKKEKLRK